VDSSNTYQLAADAVLLLHVLFVVFVVLGLESVLYYQAPSWVFVVCYTAFGALVVVSWVWVRPRSF